MTPLALASKVWFISFRLRPLLGHTRQQPALKRIIKRCHPFVQCAGKWQPERKTRMCIAVSHWQVGRLRLVAARIVVAKSMMLPERRLVLVLCPYLVLYVGNRKV